MQRRQWRADTKAIIVLEGLKGRPVAELCTAHQMSAAPYDQWRNQLLANACRAFEAPTLDQRLTHLQREDAKLKGFIGELTVELKKTKRGGNEARPLCERQRAERGGARTDPPRQSRPSLLGLSPVVGLYYIRYVLQRLVTQKRVYRLKTLHGLLVPPTCA